MPTLELADVLVLGVGPGVVALVRYWREKTARAIYERCRSPEADAAADIGRIIESFQRSRPANRSV
jgi:hypothetical protein